MANLVDSSLFELRRYPLPAPRLDNANRADERPLGRLIDGEDNRPEETGSGSFDRHVAAQVGVVLGQLCGRVTQDPLGVRLEGVFRTQAYGGQLL